MKGASCVALVWTLLVSGMLRADTMFSYTGSIQTYTVATTGTYTITAYGAQGGTFAYFNSAGGAGAEVGGSVNLSAGEVLQIVAGGQGGALSVYGGGGGGGTFVFIANATEPLLVAAGGGGNDGQGAGPGLAMPTTGSSGHGGYGEGGGGGAGWLTNGQTGFLQDYGGGGYGPSGAFAGGGGAGAGGYGGGGGGGALGGGGGGGYSGGAGGGYFAGGDGGISYIDPAFATVTENLSGVNTGNGFVDIEAPAVATPEPSALALLGAAGFVLAGYCYRRHMPAWSNCAASPVPVSKRRPGPWASLP